MIVELLMGPQTQELSADLSKLEKLLVEHDDQEWAARICKSNNEIQNQDFMGVERFLSSFGGMGSLNDVVLPEASATGELRNLLSHAYELATSIKRQQ